MKFWRRVHQVFRRARFNQDLDEEMRLHMELRAARLEKQGVGDAEGAARRAFGNPLLLRERSSELWGLGFIDMLRQDLRYAFRQFLRNPAFTTVVNLTLAVGIGANIAVFSLLDAVLLRPMPVASPQQLVLIDGQYQTEWSLISYPMYRDLAGRQQVFSEIVASCDFYATPLRVRTRESSESQAVRGGAVSGNYFSALGLVPAHGRLFVAADDGPSGPASVAVVSYDFWQRQLAGASSVVGQVLSINEEPFTVVGVAPAGFRGMSIDTSLEIWVPLTQFRSTRDLTERRSTFFRLFGRLKPGITITQAEAAMTLLFQQFRAQELEARAAASSANIRAEDFRIVLKPGEKGFGFFRERLSRTLMILMAMAVLLVAIVCMNLTTLLSARATAKQREIAVRLALGVSRRRLLQQLLTENVLLTMLGAALGLMFAVWASKILLTLVSTEIAFHGGFNRYVPDALLFSLNLRVLTFVGVIALVVSVFLALAPALLLNRPDLITPLKQKSGNLHNEGVGPLRIPLRKILVVSQVAVTVVLLVGAGLMVRTVINLRGLDPGFDSANVLALNLDGLATRRTGTQLTAFERSLHEQLNALPTVRSASLSWISLFSDSDLRIRVTIDGETPSSAGQPVPARMDAVSAGYFETIGMAVDAGRTFTTRDDAAATQVAIVNEAFVRRLFASENPIGKRFRFSTGGLTMSKEIVGIVRDAKYNDLRESTMEMFYIPLLQSPTTPARSIQVRGVGPLHLLVQEIRQIVRDADPNIVITESETLANRVDRTLVRERLLANLSVFFGAAALLLACVGLYSVLAYHVIQRTQEIGVRIALGSSPAGVMWLVMRDALLMVGLGVAIGVPAALVLSRSVASQLFGISPTDPGNVTVVVAVLLGVAVLACYLPARRAAAVDPIIALGSE